MDYATADGWEKREKMKKISGENIPDDDLRKNENKGGCTKYYDLFVFARIIAILKKRGKFAQRIYCIFYICFDSRSLIANNVK